MKSETPCAPAWRGDVWSTPTGKRWKVSMVFNDGTCELERTPREGSRARVRYFATARPADLRLDGWQQISSAIDAERPGRGMR